MKASLVVKSTKSKELEEAFKHSGMNPNKYIKSIDSQYSDEEEDKGPMAHEAKLEVNLNLYHISNMVVTYFRFLIGSHNEYRRCYPPWPRLLHYQGELDRYH